MRAVAVRASSVGATGVRAAAGLSPGGQGVPGGRPTLHGAESAAVAPDESFGGAYEVTSIGADTLAAFGINLGEVRRSCRRFAGACLDWTQRRPHLNGALGGALTARLLELGWFERGRTRRALRLTDAGREGLAETFGCVIPD